MKSKLDDVSDEEIQKAIDAIPEWIQTKQEKKEMAEARASGLCSEEDKKQLDKLIGLS